MGALKHFVLRGQDTLETFDFGCFTGDKPMSGFYSVIYALSTCQKVTLYGFDEWTDEMTAKPGLFRYHYFDNEVPRVGAHNFDATYYMYRLLETGTNGALALKRVQVRHLEEIDLNTD